MIKAQPIPDPLSERELQILQLIAHSASNQEIRQELMIAIDTVKRHVSNIFAKLGVQNRVQAIRQAREFDLLDEDPEHFERGRSMRVCLTLTAVRLAHLHISLIFTKLACYDRMSKK